MKKGGSCEGEGRNAGSGGRGNRQAGQKLGRKSGRGIQFQLKPNGGRGGKSVGGVGEKD